MNVLDNKVSHATVIIKIDRDKVFDILDVGTIVMSSQKGSTILDPMRTEVSRGDDGNSVITLNSFQTDANIFADCSFNLELGDLKDLDASTIYLGDCIEKSDIVSAKLFIDPLEEVSVQLTLEE